MELPDDHALTRDGMPATGGGRVLLLACGALAREVLALSLAAVMNKEIEDTRFGVFRM